MKALLATLLFGAGTCLAQTTATSTLHQQAEALNTLYAEASKAKGADKLQQEQAFFTAFPGSFMQLAALYGFDDSGDTTAFGALHSSPEHLRLFAGLTAVPKHDYYAKYLRIAQAGYWQQGNLNIFQNDLKNKLLADTRVFVDLLKPKEEKEVRSFFQFLFDGLQPGGDELSKAWYDKTQAKLKKLDPEISLVFRQEYSGLSGEQALR